MSGRRLELHTCTSTGAGTFHPPSNPAPVPVPMDPAVPRSPVPASFRSLWECGRQSGSHLVRLLVHADVPRMSIRTRYERREGQQGDLPETPPCLDPAGPAEPPAPPGNIPHARHPLRALNTLSTPIPASPDQRSSVRHPLSHFARTSFELCVYRL